MYAPEYMYGLIIEMAGPIISPMLIFRPIAGPVEKEVQENKIIIIV